ncbi:MAG TPA: carboxypeptidase-like regulatory domain-containing protein [Candidatus Limnocylindria bacterium]|jgi:hypothetical protein|nr:carboxypeptidase-like regulatory domain-containing protein [Candidatus Limnocylindria bacterium]
MFANLLLRGDKAEISVTVRDSSGEPISAPANVKIFKQGMPTDQKEASHVRAFFILRSLGDYTLVVSATGYKTAQKDVAVPVAVKAEVDIYLQKESATGDNTGIRADRCSLRKRRKLSTKDCKR